LQLVEVLTLNEDTRDGEELLEVIWGALKYFPGYTWESVNYRGNLDIGHHLEIERDSRRYGAFLVNRLVSHVRKLKKAFRTDALLLALTRDPVIITFFRLESNVFRNVAGLVRDYVTDDVGMVSLFETDEEDGRRVAAHGLGHNRGLVHHEEPLGLMYVGLLDGLPIQTNGFCVECSDKLEKSASSLRKVGE